MIFIFPVPLWFVGLWVLGGLVFMIWQMVYDADAESEWLYRVQHPRNPEEMFPELRKLLSEPGSCPEFQHLLKRLAATRGQV